jgi:hypothetical protein
VQIRQKSRKLEALTAIVPVELKRGPLPCSRQTLAMLKTVSGLKDCAERAIMRSARSYGVVVPNARALRRGLSVNAANERVPPTSGSRFEGRHRTPLLGLIPKRRTATKARDCQPRSLWRAILRPQVTSHQNTDHCAQGNFQMLPILAQPSPSAGSRLDVENAPRVCGIRDPLLTLERMASGNKDST